MDGAIKGPAFREKKFFLNFKKKFRQPLCSGGGGKALMARPLQKNVFLLNRESFASTPGSNEDDFKVTTVPNRESSASTPGSNEDDFKVTATLNMESSASTPGSNEDDFKVTAALNRESSASTPGSNEDDFKVTAALSRESSASTPGSVPSQERRHKNVTYITQ